MRKKLMAMKIRLNSSMFRSQLSRHYGGSVDKLKTKWDLAFTDNLNKSTIYGWRSGKRAPADSEKYLRLCGMLDIDPCLLIGCDINDDDAVHAIRRVISQGRFGDCKFLSFVTAFSENTNSWPPEHLSENYYGRSWCVADVESDPATLSNAYLRLELRSTLGKYNPVVYHFAHKRPSDTNWQHYGAVYRLMEDQGLVHISGDRSLLNTKNEPNEYTYVETWVGPNAHQFKIASMHPFNCTATDKTNVTISRFTA